MINRYEYASELEYQLHIYEDKVDFAKCQILIQLRSAMVRKREEEFELKMYGGIFLAIEFLIAFSFTMSLGLWNFLALIGVPILFIGIAGWVFVRPICVYKVVKGVILFSVNRQNTLGEWLMERYEIPTCGNEINTCQLYLNKYNLYLENIEQWKTQIAEKKPGFSEEQIMEQLKRIDKELKPEIGVATIRDGNLKKVLKRITIVGTVIVYGLILLSEFKMYLKVLDTIEYLFRQVVS